MGVADAHNAADPARSRNPVGIVAGKCDEAALRRFVEAALWIGRTDAPWRDLPDELGRWPSVYHRSRRWPVRGWWELVFEALRPALPADGPVLLDSTTCKARRAASDTVRSNAEAGCLGRSRGGICSKSGEPLGSTFHACADGAGCVLRLVPSFGQHSGLRHAPVLVSGIPARVLSSGPPTRLPRISQAGRQPS